ncbi:uncharacterized protein F4807DRAFT_434684 [Annulohypoxylon truncatum]|uniref:uncharacterized protein n=1 Tax=Annulohypoxylon truncatum TaxID=327061 RepID=UPI002008CD99|nr:uncharacterized protein F4807DRAFT_434684 [Annulohypoxylon truncatum]KAI1207467.1 hypothetical protein F4807DRAFT_434684 [Annulohypoxylon truncatum]
MFRRIVSVLAASGSLVRASTSTNYSFKTEGACSTVSGSGGSVPLSLPRSTTTSTVSSIITNSEVTVPSTVTVTADPVTTTVLTSTTWVLTDSTKTLPPTTSWSVSQIIVATATVPETVCTNDVTPSTVTEYSGSYTPISGQVTTIPTSYPSQVVCATGVTWFTILQPTATSGVTTQTTTPTSTVQAITTTVTSTYFFNNTVYASTITSTTTSYTPAASATTISTACEATTTTTFAAKCAPTNVISGVDDHGLVSGKYAANSSVIYIQDDKFNDPSTCCQLCQDNKGCAGMMAGISGFCGLLYVADPAGGPSCDFIFSYQTQSNVFPMQGLWVQSGCGEIDYTGSDGV